MAAVAEASEHLLTQDEEDWRNPKPEDADTVSHVADVRACEHWRVVRTERVGLPGYEPLPRHHCKDSNPKRSEAQLEGLITLRRQPTSHHIGCTPNRDLAYAS